MGYLRKEALNLQELEEMLQEEWKIISVWDIQNRIDSMPRRVAAFIAVKGGHTKYQHLQRLQYISLKVYTRNQ